MKKFIVAIAALALMAGSAYAADWNFYGSARVSTFWSDSDVIDGASGDTQFSEFLQGNSRIGATVKVSDELTGGFEYGTGVNVRKLYGEWNFGAGTFLVGQTYTPLNWFYSNQVFGTDNDLLAQGGIYSGRNAMLRLKFGAFQIAAIEPNTNISDLAGGSTAAGNTEVKMPALEATYSLSFDALTLELGAGYQTFETGDLDVDTWVVALGAKLNLGAFYLNGNVYTGDNVGNLMALSVDGDNGWDDGYAAVVGGDVYDNEALGALIVAGYKVNDMFALEAGYGYLETEYDGVSNSDDEVCSYYLQATITMAPGVFVTPEIGVIDGEEDGDSEVTYFGAKWQINF